MDADGLTESERAFVAAYDRHLGNGQRAWMELHKDCTPKSAREQASRLLSTNLNVRRAVDAKREDRVKRLQLDGDYALGLVARDATADIRDLFDEDGNLLKPHEWPEGIADSVESIDYEKGKIKLVSKHAARRMILEQTGKLKTIPDSIDALAAAIRQDLEDHGAGS